MGCHPSLVATVGATILEVVEGDTVQSANHFLGLLSLLSKEIPLAEDRRRFNTSPFFLGDEDSLQAIFEYTSTSQLFHSFFIFCSHPHFLVSSRATFSIFKLQEHTEYLIKVTSTVVVQLKKAENELEGVKKWNVDIGYRMIKR